MYASGSDTWAASLPRLRVGARVVHILDGTWGTVRRCPRDPVAHETNKIWVAWDDGEPSFCDRSLLERVAR